MTTLDFELEIRPGATGSYPVVARGPSGEVATTLRWSLTPTELDLSTAVLRRAPTDDESAGGGVQPGRAVVSPRQ